MGLPMNAAIAATGNCAALGRMPAVIEIGEGFQQDCSRPWPSPRPSVIRRSPMCMTPAALLLLTGVAPGATSLMVWTACSSEPRQSMVFVQGSATAALTSTSRLPSDDPTLPSQVQTDIRFVEVSRTKLKEATASLIGVRGNFLFGSPGTLPDVGGVPTPKLPVNNGQFNFSWIGGKTMAIINALEGSGFAYTLARPSLVALSGQSASFLAGGEIPIPVPSSGSER
jgi:pilus assembly protein CpaC